MKVIEWAKSHKWTVLALLVGCVVTFIIVRRAAGGTTVIATPSQGVSEEAQMQMAALQAQAQYGLAAKGLEADTTKYLADKESSLGLAQIQASLTATLKQLEQQQAMFTLQTGAALDAKQLDYNLDTRYAELDYDMARRQLESNDNFLNRVFDALKPAPAPTPTPTPSPTPLPAQPSMDLNPWDNYLLDNPDVAAEYGRVIAVADKNSPWFSEHGLDQGAEGFAQWHYANYGAGEGRQLAS